MEYFIIQKKGEPYVSGGFWCIDLVLSSSETGTLYKDTATGDNKRYFSIFKKGDVYIPKLDKVLDLYNGNFKK